LLYLRYERPSVLRFLKRDWRYKYGSLPPNFLTKLREICDREGILLILDEVQTGFGRTGKFFALEHYGVLPDILVIAKGLASGLPMSGVAASMDMMSKWIVGTHGGTYGGNPVAAAAASATIKVIRDTGLLENALERGRELLDGLEELQGRWPFLGEVRGMGLMVGLEIGIHGRNPDPVLARRIQATCLDSGILLLTCGTYGNVLRWIPPLIVTEEQIRNGLLIFEEALDAINED